MQPKIKIKQVLYSFLLTTKMKKVLFSLSNPPTKQFLHTKHNIARLFVDQYLLKKINPSITKTTKYTHYEFKDHPNFLVCTSQTYMNLSGKPLQSFIAKNRSLFNSKDPTNNKPKSIQQILKDHFIIAHDDLEHKFGNIRIKQKGSAQGHNGIKSIIATFGTNDFKRLHLGIDRPTSNDPEVVAKYVLSNFTRNQLDSLKQTIFPKVFTFLQKQQII